MSIQRRSHGSVTIHCATDREVRQVFIAGDFNGWNPDVTPMEQIEPGLWRATVGLTPGEHPYKFIVDGDWQVDPDADSQVCNGMGGCNSVVRVPMQGSLDPLNALPLDTTRLSRRSVTSTPAGSPVAPVQMPPPAPPTQSQSSSQARQGAANEVSTTRLRRSMLLNG